jgi:hypothetical protein
MAKISAKNAMVLINGSDFSTYADSYTTSYEVDPVKVTGFSDGADNFIRGLSNAKVGVNFFWETTATTGIHAKLSTLSTGNLTIIPETPAVGGSCLSLPYKQTNYNPAGAPADAIRIGTVDFLQDNAAGSYYGLEGGLLVQHATITTTTTSAATALGTLGGTTRNVSGILQVRIAPANDTYVVIVQHATTAGGSYSTILTFSANGSTVTSERQVAAVALNDYIKVVATRTGSAGQNFGFSVALWHS